MKRPRVLLMAEAANPEWVSVPLVGWSHSRALAQLVDAHLVTQWRNREAILKAGLVEGRDFTAIDSEAVAAPLTKLAYALAGKGKGWTLITAFRALTNYYFEHVAWKAFGPRIAAHEYDLVHRVTPLSPTIPSPMARRCQRLGVPFILGPLNGGVAWPWEFDSARRKEREWLSYVRGAYKLLPGYRSTRDASAAILVASRATLDQVPRRYRERCIYIPENGIDLERFTNPVEGPVRSPLRVCFVGRLVPYKGADMLVEAAAPMVKAGTVRVDIIGDGPEMARLKGMAAGLGAGIRLEGWVEHAQLQHRMTESDVLGFPSIREFGGGVVLEAMALGLAPMVVNYGGPGELVTEGTGFRLPMGPRARIVSDLRALLERLVAAPEVVRPMGAAARRRVLSLLTWEAKARQVGQVYDWVLGRRPDKPDFGMPLAEAPADAAEPALAAKAAP